MAENTIHMSKYSQSNQVSSKYSVIVYPQSSLSRHILLFFILEHKRNYYLKVKAFFIYNKCTLPFKSLGLVRFFHIC